MEIIERFDDHVTVWAYDLPSDTVYDNDLYDSEDVAEVNFTEVQEGDELTGEIMVTSVTINNEMLSTTWFDRARMTEYIKDYFKEMQE